MVLPPIYNNLWVIDGSPIYNSSEIMDACLMYINPWIIDGSPTYNIPWTIDSGLAIPSIIPEILYMGLSSIIFQVPQIMDGNHPL